MSAYKLHSTGQIIRLSDGAWIPPDPGNADYRDYQTWVEEGGVPDPADDEP